MTYLVTDNCIRCKYTDCVAVCPVDCFHEGPNFLAIDPDVCIDCAVCVPECPIGAIVPDNDENTDVEKWKAINAELSKQWPNITARKDPLPDAEEWKDVPNKLEHLIK